MISDQNLIPLEHNLLPPHCLPFVKVGRSSGICVFGQHEVSTSSSGVSLSQPSSSAPSPEGSPGQLFVHCVWLFDVVLKINWSTIAWILHGVHYINKLLAHDWWLMEFLLPAIISYGFKMHVKNHNCFKIISVIAQCQKRSHGLEDCCYWLLGWCVWSIAVTISNTNAHLVLGNRGTLLLYKLYSVTMWLLVVVVCCIVACIILI